MKKTLLTLLFGFVALVVSAQQIRPFVEGDRVTFVGNSITCGGRYHSYVWLYYMTRFPDLRIEVINQGIGGDRTQDIYKRWADIQATNPTMITLSFGMNDSGYYEFYRDDAREIAEGKVVESQQYFELLEQKYLELGDVDVVMIGSSPYDETAVFDKEVFPTKNTYIRKIIAFQRDAAEKNAWSFLDFNEPMTAINQREQEREPSFTLCGGDRIHPANDGHLVMAYLFLKEQGMAGKKVAGIEVDAKKKKAGKLENCRVTNIRMKGDTLSFDYLAKSLPFPMDTINRDWDRKSQADGLKVIPFMEEFNMEELKVKNLPVGEYLLYIAGEAIADLTAEQLSEGINLAEYKSTPQYKQALEVMQLNEDRWAIERRSREYYWVEYNLMRERGLLYACNEAAVDTLIAHMPKNIFVAGNADIYLRGMHQAFRDDWTNRQQELVEKIYRINQPKTLTVELVKK